MDLWDYMADDDDDDDDNDINSEINNNDEAVVIFLFGKNLVVIEIDGTRIGMAKK